MRNGSFEQAEGDRPSAWRRVTWGGSGRLEHESVGRTGERSVLLASDEGGDLSWATTVPVEPFARYRLSAWIRTEDVEAGSGRGALLNLHDMQPLATPAVTGTQDWTLVELEFETEDRDAVQVNCLLGGWGLSTGKAWYDDVELVLLERQPQPEPFISVHADQVGEPISEYVYGQFIEHLGRCIQGGIWAEMLDDRKFFHAVGSAESPWEVIGPAEALTMSRADPFVGEHTPELELAGSGLQGLQQAGLAFQAGREYEGRVWLAGPVEGGRVTVMIGGVTADGSESYQSVGAVSQLGAEWQEVPFSFVAGSERDDGRLIVVSDGRGKLRVGAASLMPADNVEGMRTDTLELLRRLDSPVYRWPGGNFVSGYDWRDGIGDRDRRPPRKNPAWQGVEPNDFGLDEFLAFCRELGTEPYIAINTGLGSVESAVDELLYANAPAATPRGAQRAANGHPEPYGVRFWGVGNEMYGGWQLGHVPLEEYIPRHNAFVEALRAADPTIELVAVGAVGPWSEGMMRECAEHMDLVSEHFYCQERSSLRAHVRQIPDAVRRIAEAHRRYRAEIAGLADKDIRVALDEWNYWYGPHVFGELGTRYFLKDGLGIAAGLNEIARHSDLFYMANYAQTVNVIGAIKTSRTSAAMETTGLVLELYRHRFGVLPARTESASPLDAQAAWSADRKTLTLAVVHPALARTEVPLEVRGARLTGSGTCYVIAGDDPQAFNDPDQPPGVTAVPRSVEGLGDTLTLPPCSVTLWVLDVE
jgi:alpha-N-arabinofuranosidase